MSTHESHRDRRHQPQSVALYPSHRHRPTNHAIDAPLCPPHHPHRQHDDRHVGVGDAGGTDRQ